ncbi:hypothetical protein FUAX_07800 [Fulvitalea axinellae]|uniref:TonB-dependent receptor plug domain-containing protein n=1 Tax=Fulvitalea axinellae TaxID=1182444 RepID=A0AAU9CXK4_9BACT|nr:hypothetical protein FUAX_07800 [Fulvitalea axinellae]
MNRRHQIFACVACAFFFVAFTQSQDDGVKTVIAKMQRFFKERASEKVYLHTDRSYYFGGDDLWYSAYLLEGKSHALLPGAETIYIDLLDGNGKAVDKHIVRANKGFARGNIELPVKIPQGNYQLVARTKWMENFGEHLYYRKTIRVLSRREAKIRAKITQESMEAGTQNGVRVIKVKLNTDSDTITVAERKVAASLIKDGKLIKKKNLRTDSDGELNWVIPESEAAGIEQAELRLNIKVAKTWGVTKGESLYLNRLPKLEFFPEGGDMVIGLQSRVGVRVTMPDGKPGKLNIAIMDSEGERKVSFASTVGGRATFALIPEEGKTYYAVDGDSEESTYKIRLPEAKPSGITMSVNPMLRKGIVLQASASPDLKKAYAVFHSRDRVVYAGELDFSSLPSVSLSLPKKYFPSGISCVTLFDSQLRPRSERIFFVDKYDRLGLEAVADRQAYDRREKVTLKITAKTPDGQPVRGRFSLAVTDAGAVPADDQSGILGYLMAESDLGVEVPEARNYFRDPSRANMVKMDLRLMTDGWRRFTWPDVLVDSLQAPTIAKEDAFSFSGQVLNLWNKPSKDALVLLSAGEQKFFVKTEEDGRFDMPVDMIADTTKIEILARNKKGKDRVILKVDSVRSSVTRQDAVFPVPDSLMAKLQAMIHRRDSLDLIERVYNPFGKTVFLDEVTVSSKRIEEEKRDEMRGFMRGASHTLTFDDDNISSYNTVFDMLMGMPGVSVIGTTVTIRGGGTPGFYLDGVQTDLEMIETLNPLDIDFIDVFKGANAAIFGMNGGNGVIAFYTKRGEARSNGVDFSIVKLQSPGYRMARKFANPDYSKELPEHVKPDRRVTLYWTPLIVTDEAGEATVTFFTGDKYSEYHVDIQGIDPLGRAGATQTSFKTSSRVERPN